MGSDLNRAEQLVFDVVSAEWDLFQLVENTGGRASCQDDPDTFFKMRMSQWMIYSEETLESYLNDLMTSANEGRNLVYEKYGHMMETTFPDEYEKVKATLPVITDEANAIIDELADIHVKWDKQVNDLYPALRSNGRVFTSADDSMVAGSSSESYLRGEYKTYSLKTLKLIKDQTVKAYENGENLLLKILENEVRFYGYESIEDADKKAKVSTDPGVCGIG